MLEEYAHFLEQGRYFANALEQLELILKTLVDEKTFSWEHGDIERWLSTAGNELLRRLLQGYFDQRTEMETIHESVEGSDSIVRTHRRQGVRRKLTTQLGDIDHHRIAQAQAEKPSKARLGPGEKKNRKRMATTVAVGFIDIKLDKWPNPASFSQRMAERESVTGALRAEGLMG